MSAPFDTITTNKFAGYGMRKLTSSWAGNCFLCRRSSDNATQNIGFDVSGNVDVASFSAFIGVGQGFIDTLYDQSGNGFDLVQHTAANQPQVILNATAAGRPIMRFDGSASFLLNSALGTTTVANLTCCMVLAVKGYADNDGILVFDDTTGSGQSDFNRGWVIVTELTTSGIQVGSGVKNGGTFSSAQVNQTTNAYEQLSAWYIDQAGSQAQNGVVVNSGAAQTTTTSSANQLINTAQLALGCRILNGTQYSNFGQVDIAEVVLWSADDSASGTRGPVETDQTNYYLNAPVVIAQDMCSQILVVT